MNSSINSKINEKKTYKYLYKIRYKNAKEDQAEFYIGSRISHIEPELDFWNKYRTSSKVIRKIVIDEGVDSFETVFIKEMPIDCNLLYEEHLLLIEVDAKNNPKYFNLHNNEGFSNEKAGMHVCPKCKTKQYGLLFEACNKCGYRPADDAKFYCKKCGNELRSSQQKCEKCGYNAVLDNKCYCKKCGNQIKTAASKCDKCGYACSQDALKFCAKCGKQLKNSMSRCLCGYSITDDTKYKCKKCGNMLNNPSEKCKVCGHRDTADFKCKKCGSSIGNNPSTRCQKCGYSAADDQKVVCKSCGAIVKSSFTTCSNCGMYKCGSSEWKKFNPLISLQLNGEELKIGTPEECIEFMKSNLDVTLSKKQMNGIVHGEIYNPKTKSKTNELKDLIKYKGLTGIKVERK